MKCADPILCYTTNKKRIYRHFSLASPIVKLCHDLVFDCGKCIFCRKKRSTELALRCVLHSSLYSQNCFLTLTYDETKPDYQNSLDYTHIQKFKKSLRRHCEYHYNKKIQIFNVHEFGKNGKKHWHLVVFNHQFEDKEIAPTKQNPDYLLYTSKTLAKLWPYGFNTIGDVNEASAMYQSQYTQKDIKNGNETSIKKAHSKHSGIGKDYFLKHFRQILLLGYIPVRGKKMPIPRYFQKLAHKHYCHFYEPTYFFDTHDRKKVYSPFKPNTENREIADLYLKYSTEKQKFTETSIAEWETSIESYIWNRDTPPFRQSATNYLHDLNNKKQNDL